MPKLSVVALSPDITDTGVVREALFTVAKTALLLEVGGGVPVNSVELASPLGGNDTLALVLTLSTESVAVFFYYSVFSRGGGDTAKDIVAGSVGSEILWEALSPFGGFFRNFIDSEERISF